MPTYDGTTIITGTLYENGNIITKRRIPAENPIENLSFSNFSVKSGRKKNKVSNLTIIFDLAELGNFSIKSGKKDTKILLVEQSPDPIMELGNFSIKGAIKKTAIIEG